MTAEKTPHKKGRGSQISPPNHFESTHVELDLGDVESDVDYLESLSSIKTVYYQDESESIVSENNSPDIGFRYSVNPYRGCLHGCAYCYARPSHEFLGLNAGIDFESKIMVKERAPELFRNWLARSSWQPEMIVFSGVTDCYQPIESKLKLTRACLQVASEANQPIGIVTKNALVTRDIDLLKPMAELNTVRAAISVTTLDNDLARVMEPRTSTPTARLRAINQLSDAGISTCVMIAPIIPGLNDSEIPAILKAAAEHGADSATFVLLRLPLNVNPVFMDWLDHHLPGKKNKIVSRLKSMRGGKLNDSSFETRMRGTGEIANQIKQTFSVFKKKFALNNTLPPLSTDHFRAPKSSDGQLRLF